MFMYLDVIPDEPAVATLPSLKQPTRSRVDGSGVNPESNRWSRLKKKKKT